MKVQSAILTIFLMLLVGACRQAPVATPPRPSPHVEEPQNAAQLIGTALASMKVAGIPDPPLSPNSSRQQRQDYLLATETALSAIRKLSSADPAPIAPVDSFGDRDRSGEVVAIGRLLAVDFADAIDRSSPQRAAGALRTALYYQELVARESISAWLASGSVSDHLIEGVKSVAKQVDSKMADVLRRELAEADKQRPDPFVAIKSTINRLTNWQGKLAKSGPLKVEQVLRSVSGDTANRPALSQELQKALEAHCVDGSLPQEFVAKESKIAVAEAERYATVPNAAKPMPDAKQHPLAALYLSLIRPSIEAASTLGQMREENIRLLSLTVRLLAAELPGDLSVFGDDALSPVTGMPFEYKKTKSGFDLVRPRAARTP